MSSYRELLEEYLFVHHGRNLRVTHKWYFKIWLFLKGKQYKNRRRRILMNQGKKKGLRQFEKQVLNPCVLFGISAQSYEWKSGQLIVNNLNEGD